MLIFEDGNIVFEDGDVLWDEDGVLKGTVDHTKIDSDMTNIPVPFVLGEATGIGTYPDPDDDFTGTDGDAPDSDRWTTSNGGDGYLPEIETNTLLCEIPSGATSFSNSKVMSNFELSGNFDVEVEFAISAPDTNDWMIRLALISPFLHQYIGIQYIGGVRKYIFYGWNTSTTHTAGTVNTSDVVGKLRLTRVSNNFYAYYWDVDSWVAVGGVAFWQTFADMTVTLEVYSSTSFPAITVNFDNFIINSGTVGWSASVPFDASDFFESMAYPVDDDFTGTDGNIPNPVRWETLSGASEIQSNKLQQTATQSATRTVNILKSLFTIAGNFNIQADFSHNFTSVTTQTVSLLLYIDTSNYLWIQLARDATSFLYQAYKTVGGSTAQVGSNTTTTDTENTFSIIQASGTISLKYGATTIGTLTDFPITTTFSVRIQSTNNSSFPTFQVDWDNFLINSVDSIIWSNGEPNRKKIKITGSDKITDLYAEIEPGANFSDKKAVYHVKLPDLTASIDDEYYLFYNSVWNDNTNYIGDTGEVPAHAVWPTTEKAHWLMAQELSSLFTAQMLIAGEKSGTGTTAITSTSLIAVDMTGLTKANGFVRVDLKCTNWGAVTGSQFEISSSSSPDINEWNLSLVGVLDITTAYKTFYIPLSSFDTSGGELNVSSIVRVRFYAIASVSVTIALRNLIIDQNNPSLLDSTSNGHHLSPQQNMSGIDLGDADFGKMVTFDGVYNHAVVPSNLGITSYPLTVTVKFDLPSISEGGALIHIGDPNTDGIALGVGDTTFNDMGNNAIILYSNVRWIDTNLDIGTGEHTLTLTLDSSGYPELFLDGTPIYSDTTGAPNTLFSELIYLAGYLAGVSSWSASNSSIIEVGVSSVVMSDALIKATSHALHDNLFTYSNVGGYPGITSQIPTVATPVADPEGGTYGSGQTISLSCATPDVTIYYTTDGTDPTAASTEYTVPINIFNGQLRAIAISDTVGSSAIMYETYIIGSGALNQNMMFVVCT